MADGCDKINGNTQRNATKNKQTIKAHYVKLRHNDEGGDVDNGDDNFGSIPEHNQRTHTYKQLKYSYHFPFIRLQQMNEK